MAEGENAVSGKPVARAAVTVTPAAGFTPQAENQKAMQIRAREIRETRIFLGVIDSK
jgi:hypothetical protein